MKFNSFQPEWSEFEQDLAIWRSILLFVVGVAALLVLIKIMPYSVWVIAL